MKKIKLLAIMMIIGLLAACRSGDINQNNAQNNQVTSDELLEYIQYHRFELVELNGKPFLESNQAVINFRDNLMISGKMCNQFSGQVTITDNKITSPNLVMTRMFCTSEQLNQLDHILAKLLQDGATISFDKETSLLTLQNDNQKLTYHLRDIMH